MRRPDDAIPFTAPELLRYHVVSLVRARVLAGAGLAAAVREVAGMGHATAAGGLRRVGARSVYRWLERYEQGGASALRDKPRHRGAASRVLDERLLDFMAAERANDADASVPELLRRAERRGIIESTGEVDRTTAYRALVRMGIATERTKNERVHDMRRFAYEHRMEAVLADGKHFRAGAARRRRVAYFFLDDATRLGLRVAVGTSESAELFLPAFHGVLRAYGRMGILYLDRGPGFIADSVAEVCRRLEIALVHGQARYPEGHGKIERFNQTAANAVLRALDGRAEVDPSCEALELRIAHWLHNTYNHTPHESLVRP